MIRRLTLVVTVVASVVAAVGAQPPVATESPRPPTEYEVKAAYLYSFGRFVQWPPGPLRDVSTFDLCVLGADPFGPTLDRVIAGAVVGGRRAQARRVATITDTGGCHVVFVGESNPGPLADTLLALSRVGALTVGEAPAFLDSGGMIRFVTQGGRVRFEVNLPAGQAAGLVLSSDLLRVASAVRRAAGR